MDPTGRAKLGPNPLPYISIIILLPVWIFFCSHDNALLYSVSVIITTVLKGSLFSHWILCLCPSLVLQVIGGAVVVTLEVAVFYEALNITIIPLVILVLLSTGAGVWIFLSQHHSSGEKASSSQVIGIFSRSSPDEYRWLTAELREAGKVVPFYISNSNFMEFRAQVSRCTLAILYHSKTRGRVNITDVTDSLYDEEVQCMSEVLGREKVLVVVDDLDDSGMGVRSSILQSQCTIRDRTRDLLLFTTPEKKNRELVREKLQPVIRSLSRGSLIRLPVDAMPALIVAVPWLHFIVAVYYEGLLITSNVSGSLLLYLLSPSSLASTVLPLTHPSHRQKRAPRGIGKGAPPVAIFLVMMVVELCLVWWSHSGVTALLLVLQSVGTVLYAAYLSSWSSSSAAP